MKRLSILFMILVTVFLLGGCGSSSSSSSSSTLTNGKSVTLSDVTPVCSSKENVDKLINYVREKNNSAVNSMYQRGEVKDFPKGTKVNVVKAGIVTEIETESGTHWFAPMEAIK